MSTDSFLALACGGLIVSIFGALMCFFGYRLFIVLLPLWGFFFGLMLGAESMQALFGTGFLSTVTSWVVGFIVAIIFAGLSYLFYAAAVVIVAGSLGYGVTVGILLAIGMQMGFLVWLIGIVVAVIVAVLTLVLNIQKWVIIVATSLAGAAVVFGAYFVMFAPHATLLDNPIKAYIGSSPFLMIVTFLLAAAGIVFQFRSTRTYVVESYDHWSEVV